MKIRSFLHSLRFLGSSIKSRFFPKKKPFVYVAIGDSTIEGVGASHPMRAFPALVFEAIKKELKTVNFHNFGTSGARVRDLLAYQVERAIALKPDLIIISVGFNDIARKTRLSEFEKDFLMLLKMLSQKTNAVIVVNNIPDISLAPSISFFRKILGKFLVNKFNKKIERYVLEMEAILIDIYSQTRTLKGHKELVSNDGLHPSDIGHAIWGNTILLRIWDLIIKNKKDQIARLAI